MGRRVCRVYRPNPWNQAAPGIAGWLVGYITKDCLTLSPPDPAKALHFAIMV